MESSSVKAFLAEYRKHYQQVKSLAAFVSLKQSELRPENECSSHWLLKAKEEYRDEVLRLNEHGCILQVLASKCQFTIGDDILAIMKSIDPLHSAESGDYFSFH